MKKNINMKNQKGFIQIPLLVVIVSLVILVSAGVLFPRAIGAPTFNFRPILFPRSHCIPMDEPDPETGCRACGDNARTEYEQCRQAYYLKKQTELLESQQVSQKTLTEKEQIIKELESGNQELQGLLKGQNRQIEELIQELGQQSQRIDTLATSLKNANSLNIGLSVISGVFLICLILLFIKKRRRKL